MTVTLEIDGLNYTGFKSINFSKSIENISGRFNFTAVGSEDLVFPIKRRASCRIKVNNINIINGFVEVIRVRYSERSHKIIIEGRDKTADVIDTQIDGNIEFNTPISLQRVIRQTLDRINATDIGAIDNVGDLNPYEETELVSAEVGQTAFKFIEKYARKRQVLLTSDNDGNILITRASQEILPVSLQNVIDGEENNIISGDISFDDSRRFNRYRAKSQGNISSMVNAGSTDNENTVNLEGVAFDRDIRQTRILNFVTENSSDDFTATQRAAWEANIRRTRSFSYRVTVQGATYDGTNPWPVNRLVQVIDDFGKIDAVLLIRSVNIKIDVDRGSLTDLELVYRDSYTLTPARTAADRRSNIVGRELESPEEDD